MVIKKLINKLPIRSGFLKLILGAVLVALLLSLGMVGVLGLFGFSIDPVIPSVLAGVGAAVYAAKMQKEAKRKAAEKEIEPCAEKNNISEVKKVIRDVSASWWEDGLVEVISGTVFVFIAVLIFIAELLNYHLFLESKTAEVFSMLVALMFVFLLMLAPPIKRALKGKFIWSKVGYSRPQVSCKSKMAYFLAAVILIGYVMFNALYVLARSRVLSGRLPAFLSFIYFYGESIFVGLFIFLIYLGIYFSANKKRFLTTGILGLCAAVISAPTLAFLNPRRDTVLFIVVLGVIGIYSLSTGIPRFLEFRKVNKEV